MERISAGWRRHASVVLLVGSLACTDHDQGSITAAHGVPGGGDSSGGASGSGVSAGAASGTAGDHDASGALPIDSGFVDAGSHDADRDAAQPRVLEPRIPAPVGACPDLTTGEQTIMGLQVDIVAGDPSAGPGPLLFIWHGTADTGAAALSRLPMAIHDAIQAEGGLIVAPNDSEVTRAGRDIALSLDLWFDSDFLVADQIVACAVRSGQADPRRIYATGCFGGGIMAGTMAVARSSYVAGVMLQSGGLAIADWPFDEPAHPPAAIALNGPGADLLIIDNALLTAELGDVLIDAGGGLVVCDYAGPLCNAPLELQTRAWTFLETHPFGTALDLASGLLPDDAESCKLHRHR